MPSDSTKGTSVRGAARREQRRARKNAQRRVGGVPTDDQYVRSGTVVVDRRGQQWLAMQMMTTAQNQSMWWREVDAESFRPPTADHLETALDGKRFGALLEMSGPVVIHSVPRRILGIF
jgi:ribosomal protein L27